MKEIQENIKHPTILMIMFVTEFMKTFKDISKNIKLKLLLHTKIIRNNNDFTYFTI